MEKEHISKLNLFKVAINNFINHKEISLLFQENYYKDVDNKILDTLDEFYFEVNLDEFDDIENK